MTCMQCGQVGIHFVVFSGADHITKDIMNGLPQMIDGTAVPEFESKADIEVTIICYQSPKKDPCA